jgi:phage-related holin
MKELATNLLLACILVFLPIKTTLVVVMALVGIDLVSGILAARKRGEPITSKGLQRTIVKLLAYEMVVMLGFLVEQYLTGDFVPMTKILGGMVGMTELKSVLENIEDLTGIPLIQVLIDKLTQMGSK